MYPIEAFWTTLEPLAVLLGNLDIRFHLTGGITAIAYGEPRMTQDIDIVIEPESLKSQLNQFLSGVRTAGYLFNESVIREAVEAGRMFQLIGSESALKLDLYPRELVPGEIQRAMAVEFFQGLWLPIASRTDSAISKLIRINKGSHKSRRDLRQILLRASEDELRQVRDQAAAFSLADLLEVVLNEPDELE